MSISGGSPKGIVIPSEETRITMYPMDYEEFRWAMGDTATVSLLGEALLGRQPLGDAVCRKLMRDFRLYMLVGGMPQAVNTYLDTNNLSDVDKDLRRDERHRARSFGRVASEQTLLIPTCMTMHL